MTDDDSRLDREAILARRRRFVSAAITGLTTSTLATACPCLNVAPPTQPEPDPGQADEMDAAAEAPEQEQAGEGDSDAAEEPEDVDGEPEEPAGEAAPSDG